MSLRTKSGIFVREEVGLGLLTYSPYSGLFYACAGRDQEPVLRWLNKEVSEPPEPIYAKALGAGWWMSFDEAEYPKPQILPPQSAVWDNTIIYTKKPILINWLITGNCPLNCRYCYAQDLMHGKRAEPTPTNIEQIAESILQYDPLAVVITGGDPLVSPHLTAAIKLLNGRTGVIIDTSGYSLTKQQIEVFKKYNCFIRISLDSEIPKVNEWLRKANWKFKNRTHTTTAAAALDAILKCTDNKIKFAVQSVSTKKNRSNFESFGDKLFRLGVAEWRILVVAPSKDNIRHYEMLSGDENSQKRFYNEILEKIRLKDKNCWHGKMPVQVEQNQIANAVVLVAPDGTFLTESNIKNRSIGKIVIDPEFPTQPRMERILNSVNMHAHTERYLNL